MSKIRLHPGHKTEGGNDIPPGDYSALDVKGKLGLQSLDGKTVFIASENTAKQIRGLLSNTNEAKQNTDEVRYLNHEYAMALMDCYLNLPRDKKDRSLRFGMLQMIAFMNSKGWPARDVNGDPLPTKMEIIDEVKKFERLMVSCGYTPAKILEDYKKSKK